MEGHTRGRHVRAVFGRWWWTVTVIWTCLTAVDTFVSKWGSEAFRRTWDSYWRIPKWGWKVWTIGFLCITAFFIFEASYRAVRGESKARAEAERKAVEASATITDELAREKTQRLRAEQELADEKANKLTVDEIVLREARDGFRNLTKVFHATTAPRAVLNERWVQITAERHGITIAEVNAAIDRLDGKGKFHWQL